MDRTAFEKLYTETWREILGFALRRTADREDAADIVAEVFAVAWRRRADIPPGRDGRLWLFGVARFVLANHRRGELRRSHLAGALRGVLTETIAGSSNDPASAMVSRAEAERVLATMRSLAQTEYDLLTLVAWEGLTPTEAAKVVGLSATGARVRLHRARKRLKQLLDEPLKRQRQAGHVRSDGRPPVPVRESS